MPKPAKQAKVKELTESFRSSAGAMFTEYRGLTVKDATEVRSSLREAETSFSVVKNTLTRLAARGAGLEDVLAILDGPTAVAFIRGDAVRGAKAVLEASRRFPSLVVKGAVIDGRFLVGEQARGLATLESKEVSVGKVAGLLQAPLSRMVYLLQAPLQRMAFALAERGRQGSEGEDGG
jgi:large subunit ribosomal protein L10